MPMLKNLKWEKFSQFIVQGLNNSDAYAKAGFVPCRHNASRLRRTPPVVRRIAELAAKSLAKAELSVERIDIELARIISSDLRRLFGANGEMLPPAQWPDDIASAVAAVEVSERFEGVGESRRSVGHTKKIKVWDKTTALELGMKRLGLLDDPQINLTFNNISERQLDARLKMMMSKLLPPDQAKIIDGTAVEVDSDEANW